MGKVFAITSTGKTEKSLLDLRFGKCHSVVIFNVRENQFSIVENPFKDQKNSGIQLVEFLKKQGVNTILTGEVGPKVSQQLEKDKLQLVLLSEERIKVEEVMDRITP